MPLCVNELSSVLMDREPASVSVFGSEFYLFIFLFFFFFFFGGFDGYRNCQCVCHFVWFGLVGIEPVALPIFDVSLILFT